MTETPCIFHNLQIATFDDSVFKNPYGLGADCLVISGGYIQWLGLYSELPLSFKNYQRIDFNGRLMTPGLIDCHTHLIYAGNRSKEFEQRLNGVSYAEIARSGGGIVATVKATREASEENLLSSAKLRLQCLIDEGVTTVEIKSGYGLNTSTECKMLRVARQLEASMPVSIMTSFLAAHAVPEAFRDDSDGYISLICDEMLPEANRQGLVDAVDGFCESIAFSSVQIQRVFSVAQSLGLPVKLHAEQLSDQGGAVMASEFKALSVDHLEYLPVEAVPQLAQSGTVAVLLPGAFLTLGEKQLPPLAHFRAAGVDMAVATDSNPGSSPLTSLLLAMNLACTLFRLTPEESLRGTTINAAKALGLSDRGILSVGKRADLAVWDVMHPAELCYRMGFNPLHQAYLLGEPI